MMNTPKKYKGFSKLPEAVQEKMDPEAAMKYMEGGAVKKYMGGGKVRGYKDGTWRMSWRMALLLVALSFLE